MAVSGCPLQEEQWDCGIKLADLAFFSWQVQQSILSILDEYEFLIAPLIFTFLAFFTRMYKIGLSPIVTWDEAQYVPTLYQEAQGGKQL